MHVIRGSKTGLERKSIRAVPLPPCNSIHDFYRVYFCIGILKQATSKWDLYIGLERLGFDSALKRNVGNVPDLHSTFQSQNSHKLRSSVSALAYVLFEVFRRPSPPLIFLSAVNCRAKATIRRDDSGQFRAA